MSESFWEDPIIKHFFHDPIQETERTPFLHRTMYPISVESGYFERLEQENKDEVLAKRIQKLKVEYIKTIKEYNQTIYDLDCTAKVLISKYHRTKNKRHAQRYEKVCDKMRRLRYELNLRDLFYARQKLELEVFKIE